MAHVDFLRFFFLQVVFGMLIITGVTLAYVGVEAYVAGINSPATAAYWNFCAQHNYACNPPPQVLGAIFIMALSISFFALPFFVLATFGDFKRMRYANGKHRTAAARHYA
jgi:hypothetical protein